MNKLSSCCNSKITVDTADEGTSCYICSKCRKVVPDSDWQTSYFPLSPKHPNIMQPSEPSLAQEKCHCGRIIKGSGKYRHCPLAHFPDKSLTEVKKMVEGMKDYNFNGKYSMTVLETEVSDNAIKVLNNFPLLAQTLLKLMEDNGRMREALSEIENNLAIMYASSFRKIAKKALADFDSLLS